MPKAPCTETERQSGPWTFWFCPDCGWLGYSVDGHCRQFDEHPDGPRIALKPIDLVPRSVAEALANGIVAALGLEPVRMNEAAAALAEYRAAYPKETP